MPSAIPSAAATAPSPSAPPTVWRRVVRGVLRRPWQRHERAWRACGWYGIGAVVAFLSYGLRMIVHPVEMQWTMSWNLLLAVLPVLMAWGVVACAAAPERALRAGAPILVVAWLLLVPNSLYILTDLVHLRGRHWFWVDLPAYALMAWCMIQCALLSFAVIAGYLRRWCGWTYPLVVVAMIILVMMGIHAGRFVRLNSWDMLLSMDVIVQQAPIQYDFAQRTGLTYGYGILATLLVICYMPLRHFERPEAQR